MRRDRLPYALPDAGEPVRVAFVGDPDGLGPHVLSAPAGRVEPVPDAAAADVVVVLAPESVAPSDLDAIAAPVLGIVTDPLPRADREPHPAYDANLEALRALDPARVDRLITTDANSWDAAAALGLPLWRAMPLPVDDRLYRAPRRTARPPRVLALGADTPHRAAVLEGPKRDFGEGLAHHAAPLRGAELELALEGADAGLNVHAERWIRAFEPSVLVHLAAGHLVITEVLEPLYGLEPGLDVVMVGDHYELDLRVHQLFKTPEMYDRVRLRGHHKSRQFKASIIWPRVIGDLLADLRVFGTARRPSALA